MGTDTGMPDLTGPVDVAPPRRAAEPTTLTWRGPGDTQAWAEANTEQLSALLHEQGSVLLRGFGNGDPGWFRAFVAALWDADWVEYREPGTPRRAVLPNISTSTEYDPREQILPHNENSHVLSWPARLFFMCQEPPSSGGETPIVDVRQVLETVPERMRERAVQHGIVYQRAFGYGLGFRWQDVFGVDDAEGLEAYCSENRMQPVWDGPRLKVAYRRWGVREHPTTTEPVWFNHALIYSPYALVGRARAFLDRLGFDNMPFATYWGDGSPISEPDIRALAGAYEAHARAFTWRRGDVLMVDNMLCAHGRRPFTGPRRVLVAMRGQVHAGSAGGFA